LDIALRNVDQVFGRLIQPLNLSVIEWYVLRALYERDGQHASELARAVGRAATSFTPNLDKLERKGLIERRPDPSDRRAVRIYLTKAGEDYRQQVAESAARIDEYFKSLFKNGEYKTFQEILSSLQTLSAEDTI